MDSGAQGIFALAAAMKLAGTGTGVLEREWRVCVCASERV